MRASGGEDIYTRHIATPTGLDFAKAAGLYGLSHERVGDVGELRAALERALARERVEHRRSAQRARAQRRAARARVGRGVPRAQPASSGSSADSLTSVSASSAAGSDSATMPLPA